MARDLFDWNKHRPLRSYQIRALAQVHAAISRGHQRIVLQLPTGGGKTLIAANLLLPLAGSERRMLFTTPSISLVDQTLLAFEEAGIDDIGVVQADHPRTDALASVQVATLQSLARRKKQNADFVIVDEAHVRSRETKRMMRELPNAVFVGLTATPWRKGMAQEWDSLIVGATIGDLIEDRFLADFRVFATSHPNLTKVKISAGDYRKNQLSTVMGGAKLVGDVVTTWLEKGENRPTICFAVDRAHAKHLQSRFEAAGVPTGYVDAGTERNERAIIQRHFEAGDIRVVVNVACLTTGIDWDVRCIILARPTKSEILYVQMVGRGLRTAPGKTDLLVLDHSDNTERLGFVTGIEHRSLLNGKTPRPGNVLPPKPKSCPKCGFVKPPKTRTCPACQFEATMGVGEVATIDGDLKEVRRSRAIVPPDQQEWYSELLQIAQDRRRAAGWAAHIMKAKFGHWPDGLKTTLAPPSAEVLNFVKAQDIRYAKRKGARHAA